MRLYKGKIIMSKNIGYTSLPELDHGKISYLPLIILDYHSYRYIITIL